MLIGSFVIYFKKWFVFGFEKAPWKERKEIERKFSII